MDWIVELIKASPILAALVGVIWLFVNFQRTQRNTTEQILQQYLERFTRQQQEIEQQFRNYLMKETQENRKVIEEYSRVLTAFNETVKKTNLVIEQNILINREILQNKK